MERMEHGSREITAFKAQQQLMSANHARSRDESFFLGANSGNLPAAHPIDRRARRPIDAT
jgi:hypothetical protein